VPNPNKVFWCCVLILGFLPRFAAASADSKEFIAPEPTNIPGLTLPSGSYVIEAVGHFSGRYVVRVDGRRVGHYSFSLFPIWRFQNPPHRESCFGTMLQAASSTCVGGISPELLRCSSSSTPRRKR
jgi:hypothetical protein